MELFTLLLYIFTFVTLAFLSLQFLRRDRREARGKPPSPFGLPILGHLLFLGDKPWETFLDWTRKFGPIFSVQFGQFPAVILNEAGTIREAFNSPKFSGRPKIPLFGKFGQGKSIVIDDGELIMEQRKFVQRQLKSLNVIKAAEEKIREEVQEVVEKLARDSIVEGTEIEVNHRFQVPTVNALWSLFMGQRFDQDDPQLIHLGQLISAASKYDGIFETISMFIPILCTLFPNASGQNIVLNVRKTINDFVDAEFQKKDPSYIPGQPANLKHAFKDQMEINKDDPNSSFHESMDFFKFTTADLFMAAIDTTSSQLDWFVLYMARYPQVQEKLYVEIIREIGLSRLPLHSDRPFCPYAEAVVNEILRFASITPTGVFHRVTEDIDDFHGYKIPKDTMIFPNLWAVHFNPDLWEQPKEFRPERFIGPDGKYKKSENLLPFSVGRRNCVGEELARIQLFLYVTSLVQRFEISYREGKKPSLECTPGFIVGPRRFKAIFRDRFQS